MGFCRAPKGGFMRTLTGLGCLFLFCVAAFAQSDRGTITGTIGDPAGAVVAGAVVEARNVETGALYQAATSATGNYTLSQLPAGTYDLVVTVPGFKKYIRQNIVVQVAGTLRVDVTLEVGSAAESVTVTEAAPLLKTESGELSHNMTTDRVDNLPVINLGFGAALGNVRNPLQAITLIPGSAQRGRDSGGRDPNQQLCRRVRAGGGRSLQHHHEIGQQPVPWKRLRLLCERSAQREYVFQKPTGTAAQQVAPA